jgi:hypothetical protein
VAIPTAPARRLCLNPPVNATQWQFEKQSADRDSVLFERVDQCEVLPAACPTVANRPSVCISSDSSMPSSAWNWARFE